MSGTNILSYVDLNMVRKCCNFFSSEYGVHSPPPECVMARQGKPNQVLQTMRKQQLNVRLVRSVGWLVAHRGNTGPGGGQTSTTCVPGVGDFRGYLSWNVACLILQLFAGLVDHTPYMQITELWTLSMHGKRRRFNSDV